jgi:hypothetical protein
MEQVGFINTDFEGDDDLIVAIAILDQDDPGEIRTLSLIRTPKYEIFLNDFERGVTVSDEDCADDENDMLKEIEFRGDELRIVAERAHYQLDCRKVAPDEIESTKKILRAMNFDERFRIHFS